MKDGAALRYTFKREVCNCELALDHECSMLEMMLSLAMRCELIMDDTRYGDRTMSWFWSMVASLGLNGDTDRLIDEKDVNDKIDLFLNHEYAPDGRGGLFFIYRCNTDLRDLELWDQAMLFLNKLLGY